MKPANRTLNLQTLTGIDHLLKTWSLKDPEKIAVKHGDTTISYKNLNDTSGKLASYFVENQISEGNIVAVALDRTPELIITLIALLKTGATYLPLDIKLPPNRINYMLEDSGAHYLIMSKDINIDMTLKGTLFIEDIFKECNSYTVKQPSEDLSDDNIAYILYTSGSTGKPKGVEVTRLGLTNLLLSLQQLPGITKDDVMLATTTISFDIAAVEMFLPLISGATVVLANNEIVRDGRLLLETVEKENISILQGTPAMWRNMLNSGWHGQLDIKGFCGGEAMPPDFIKNVLPKCKELWNMYGPTETTIYSAIKKISSCDDRITIGNPVANTTVYILDDNQNVIANGQVGEIVIGGAGVAAGYINNPTLTKEKFIDNKFSGKGKIYLTGDLGRFLENGEIEYLGRADQQIKVRGFRIEPGEIEHNLNNIDGIKDSLVTSFTDNLSNVHLGAYIILETTEISKKPDYHFWKSELKKSVPDYMVPGTFQLLDQLPRLSNGKIDRNGLPAFKIGDNVSAEYEKAHTSTELRLTDIFLHYTAIKSIGINDNFFELGIDSLTAVRIMVQIEQQLCKRLPLSILIQYPTIKQFANFLDNDSASLYKCLVPIKPEGDKMPLYIIHGIGLNVMNLYGMVSNMDVNQPVYGLQPIGLQSNDKPLDDMEAIAALYVKEILQHNPVGPYAIAGYSFGGYIAFEMARQLKANGKELAMLGMFDSNIQNTAASGITKKLSYKTVRQLNKVVFRAATTIKHPVLTAGYLKVHFLNRLGNLLVKTGIKKVYNPDRLPAFMLTIIDALLIAFKNYRFKPEDVKIDLFKAQVRMYYVDDPEFLGWRKLALKGVEVYNVPGDHKHMFSPPNDKSLASILQKKLNEIADEKLENKNVNP